MDNYGHFIHKVLDDIASYPAWIVFWTDENGEKRSTEVDHAINDSWAAMTVYEKWTKEQRRNRTLLDAKIIHENDV